MRYPDHRLIGGLALAATVLLAGCASTPQPAGPNAADPRVRAAAAMTPGEPRRTVIETAQGLIGTPYRYGGNAPGGFDCSGLVQYTHGRGGLAVPRTSRAQWQAASPLGRRPLLPGDLVFFAIGPDKAHHVGIYEGDGVFIHAPSSGKRVGRASMDDPYWRQRLLGARSFL